MYMPRIWVVFHSTGNCPTQFAVDLAKALRYTGTIIPAVLHEQSCYVDSARNKLVKQFLEQKDATHMMMVDVDLSFNSDAFLRTFSVLQASQADILYGNYSLGNGANSIFGPPDNKANEAAVRVNLKPNMVYLDIATGGTGWLMATREVLERMRNECPGPWHWFARDPTADGKDLRGEDITFGLRAWGMNPKPKIVGYTGLLLRHLKNQGFYASFMSQAAANEGSQGICIPNPYESNPEKFYLFNNSAVDKSTLTPEQLAQLEKYDAERTGRETTEAGAETRPWEEANGSVRVRDAKENGVEAQPGKEGTNGHGEGEVNGAKSSKRGRKDPKGSRNANGPTAKGSTGEPVVRKEQA